MQRVKLADAWCASPSQCRGCARILTEFVASYSTQGLLDGRIALKAREHVQSTQATRSNARQFMVSKVDRSVPALPHRAESLGSCAINAGDTFDF